MAMVPETLLGGVPENLRSPVREAAHDGINRADDPEAVQEAAREHIFDAHETRELHGSAQPGGWNGGCP
jgi:hypothetical protein